MNTIYNISFFYGFGIGIITSIVLLIYFVITLRKLKNDIISEISNRLMLSSKDVEEEKEGEDNIDGTGIN